MTNHVEFPGLGLSFTLNRVAFTLFGMPVYWYGILIASGLLLALLFAFWKARSYGIDADRMVDVIFGATVCAIIGGRAYYVATAPFEYESFAQMLDIRLGGVGIYGAIIAAFVSGWLLCKWRKVPVLPMFDLASMGFLIGQCIGRWGNFVNQEAFGTNTTLPWGMISENTTAYLSSVQATLAAQGITVDPNLPVHPTFLYESLWCLVGFLLLAAYEKHRRFHGEVMLMYVMWYGLVRRLPLFHRGPAHRQPDGGPLPHQPGGGRGQHVGGAGAVAGAAQKICGRAADGDVYGRGKGQGRAGGLFRELARRPDAQRGAAEGTAGRSPRPAAAGRGRRNRAG